MLAGRSCRVTLPQKGRKRAPKKCGNRARHGSQKHTTRYSRSIRPILIKLSLGKWCKIKVPTSASPAQPGSSSNRSPCLQKIARGSSAGLGARSKPVTIASGNQRATFRHKRPSPAPISTKRIASPSGALVFVESFMARRNARLTQRILPIKALIASRSSRLRNAEGSSAGR